jgi:serine/threonine protein kinase
MTNLPRHPDTDQLVAFGMGRLDPEAASTIESHLDKCPTCCETLLDLKDDTFIGLLRSAPHPGSDVQAQMQQEASRTQGEGDAEEPLDATLVLTDRRDTPAGELPPQLAGHPRYHIVGLIGRGGMGDVYRAEHRLMNRTVALKVINRELTRNAQAVGRFHREMQAAARLTHPNIVTAYDAEQAGDAHYLVMEYVDGTDLAKVVKEHGPLAVAQACDYIRQGALGLQHAHEQGMVHRDIKPHNLMVTPTGQVKILDFGLATLVRGAGCEARDADEESSPSPVSRIAHRVPPDLTTAGTMMGTPDFISPEQAGDARSVDIRSDIYSLGCTLYYLLTGRPPFDEGSAADRVAAHLDRQPEPIENLRSDIPDELADVIRRMMAKEPAERYQSPTEVADALAPFVDAHRSGEAVPPNRFNGRGGSLWQWIAAMLVPLFIGLAGIIYVTTDRGTLVIESVDDSVEIVLSQVDGDAAGEEADDATQLKFIDVVSGSTVKVLRSGTYVAKIQGDDTDLELSEDRFVLKRGDEVLVRVTRKPPSQTQPAEATAELSKDTVPPESWTPPENPDPSAILNEAHADVRAGKFELALSKLDWYYESALRIQPSQSGVRLSFALSYWKKLADQYPPALDRLRELRDEARARVAANKDPFQSFQEFAAISAELGEVEPVVTLFKRLQQTAPGTAQRVYTIAETALIATKEYKLCGPYIDPRNDVPRIIDNFRLGRKVQERRELEHKRSPRFAERKMENESATLVALLVVNDRETEARTAAEELKAAWDSETFHEAIDSALAGKVPEPWPPRFQVAPDDADSAANQATRDAFSSMVEQPPLQPPAATGQTRQRIAEIVTATRDATSEAEWIAALKQHGALIEQAELEGEDSEVFGAAELEKMQAADRRLIRLLVELPDAVRVELLEEGYLKWKFSELDPARRAAMQQALADVMTASSKMGFQKDLAAYVPGMLTSGDVGFAILSVPDADEQLVVWYLLMPQAPMPLMLPLIGSAGESEQAFTKSIYKQLGELEDRPSSKLPVPLLENAD